MVMVLENEQVLSRFNEISMFTSGDSYTECLITLCLKYLYFREQIAAAGTGNRIHALRNNQYCSRSRVYYGFLEYLADSWLPGRFATIVVNSLTLVQNKDFTEGKKKPDYSYNQPL